jgi:hypothetical protein
VTKEHGPLEVEDNFKLKKAKSELLNSQKIKK